MTEGDFIKSLDGRISAMEKNLTEINSCLGIVQGKVHSEGECSINTKVAAIGRKLDTVKERQDRWAGALSTIALAFGAIGGIIFKLIMR